MKNKKKKLMKIDNTVAFQDNEKETNQYTAKCMLVMADVSDKGFRRRYLW